MMIKRIKEKWLRALRSNKYKQAQSFLHVKADDDVSFCCLGVLCDLHSQETNHPWDGRDYRAASSFLPDEVIEWAGLPDKNPHLSREGRSQEISSWNDDYHKTFDELADMIEEQL